MPVTDLCLDHTSAKNSNSTWYVVFFVTDLPVRVSLVGVMSSFKSASETSGTLSVRYTKFFSGSDVLERWAHRTAILLVFFVCHFDFSRKSAERTELASGIQSNRTLRQSVCVLNQMRLK